MKAEQRRLELEAQAEKEKSQRERLQMDMEAMDKPSGEPQASETSQKGTGDLMTNVLSRRPSTQSADPAEEPPFNLEKYANHPLSSIRQAYKDLKASEGLKASMQKEWETSQAADKALACSNYAGASRLLRMGAEVKRDLVPKVRFQGNVGKDDA